MAIYRLYTFTNYYLSDKQLGIQSLHIVGEMANRNTNVRDREPVNDGVENSFEQWCRKDKTVIVLNGGNSASLNRIYYELQKLGIGEDPIFFREDEESLNGALTAVGILIPDVFWKREENPKWDNNEVVLVRKFLEKFDLA